jgi:hypothetical protein
MGDRVRWIAIGFVVLMTLVAAGGVNSTSAQVPKAEHRFSGAPTDFLVDGSSRTLDFLLIAETPLGVVLAQSAIDPAGQWVLSVPAPLGVSGVIFRLVEIGDPTEVSGSTEPFFLVASGDTRLTELRFQSPLAPAFDISGE